MRGFVPNDGLHLQQVDNAGEAVFSADRHHDRHRIAAQAGLHLLHGAEEVGALTVHLVHERDARNLVLVSLTPYGFRLRLHAAHGAVHHHGAVQNTHGTLYLDGKVHVSRGVDDVEAMLRELHGHTFPEGSGRSGGDRDATLLFLLHPVHGGGAIMHFTDFVVYTGVKQNTLGSSGLTGVDVSGDTDVTVALNGVFLATAYTLIIGKA